MSHLRFRPLQGWAHTAGLLLVPDRPHLLSSTFPPTRYPTAHSGLEPAEVPNSKNESNITTSITNHPLHLGPQPPSTPIEPPSSPTPPNTIPPSFPHLLPHSSPAHTPRSLAARAGQGRQGSASTSNQQPAASIVSPHVENQNQKKENRKQRREKRE